DPCGGGAGGGGERLYPGGGLAYDAYASEITAGCRGRLRTGDQTSQSTAGSAATAPTSIVARGPIASPSRPPLTLPPTMASPPPGAHRGARPARPPQRAPAPRPA